MGAENFENIECLCSFLTQMGTFKDTFISLVDVAIGFLRTAQVAIALVPQDMSDQLRKYEYQLELEGLNLTLETVSGPLSLVTAQFKPYADCPPVASTAKVILDFKNEIISGIQGYKDKIEALIDALDLEGQKIEELENWIKILEDVKDAVTFCGV